MDKNLDLYELHMANASKQGAEIIVFPEDGLYGSYFVSRQQVAPYLEQIPIVSNGDARVVPCGNATFDDRPILRRISCLAKRYRLVTVVNMGDVQPCGPSDPRCPADGQFQYNTAVAVSETGQLLAKYHKSHLYGEVQFDQPPAPDVTYFDTSFGVRFGLLTCFDIMFAQPQETLYALNVTDIAFDSWWVNFPPLITATQVQQAVSAIHGINLLAAGIGQNFYSSGSGLYSNGTVVATYYNSNETFSSSERLLVGRMPTLQSERHLCMVSAASDPRTSPVAARSALLDAIGTASPSRRSSVPAELPFKFSAFINGTVVPFEAQAGLAGDANATHGTLQCSATYVVGAAPRPAETFALLAYEGTYGMLQSVQVCALLRCPTAQPESCTDIVLSVSTVFESFSISGNFSGSTAQSLLPLVATDGAAVVDKQLWTAEDGELRSEDFKLSLLNAALFGVVWS